MTCATSELYYQPWHPRSLIHRSLVTHKAHSDQSDQTGWILRLILFLSGCTDHLVDLSRSTSKPTKWPVRPAKTQISLGIRPVWSECLLCDQCVAKDPRFLHADSEDSDQTGRMPRLIWVFAGRTVMLLVLSCVGSFVSRSSPFSFSINHHHHYFHFTEITFIQKDLRCYNLRWPLRFLQVDLQPEKTKTVNLRRSFKCPLVIIFSVSVLKIERKK